MSQGLAEVAGEVLRVLSGVERDEIGDAWIEADELADRLDVPPPMLNDAVTALVDSGYADWMRYMGTAPYKFGRVQITPAGRFELEESREGASTDSGATPDAKDSATTDRHLVRRRTPAGSPYGFQDEDWEIIAERRARGDQLRVVFGHQFESDHYDTPTLQESAEQMFEDAVDEYNKLPDAPPVKLVFEPLAAGYGEHLFNEIAREIISSDIAVFETSNMNANVMIEMGVALTWGVRVLPIKKRGQPEPPSDISGQTWVDYVGSGQRFVDPGHDRKLIRMVERAARKKLSS